VEEPGITGLAGRQRIDIAGGRTVNRMAPLTRFANNEPEPPGSSANTVYMFIGSHFLR